MATVRRPLKRRRTSPTAEAKAWRDVFDHSFDWFDDLEPFGFPNGDDKAKREAAEDAWRRLGAIHMANRDPAAEGVPWALETFGEPYADR